MLRSIRYTLFAVSMILCSCDAIYDEGGDCSSSHNVRFIADMNLQRADVFNQDITSISLYVFDENNMLVMQKSEGETKLRSSAANYMMDITGLPAGRYHLVAWAQLENNDSFTLTDLTRDISRLDQMSCRLKRTRSVDGIDYVDTNLDPIYHGMTDIVIPDDPTPDSYTYDIHLTKDVKNVTVLLQQLDGSEMKVKDYDINVEANNGRFNHDNTLLQDDSFIYQAYSTESVLSDLSVVGNTRDGESSGETASAVLAHISTARLVDTDWTQYTRPMLTVNDANTGKAVLAIPLIDYALLVRSKYNSSMDTQEYLDRMDEINLTLFLNGDKWINNVVIINSWRIVINDDDFQSN